MNSRDFLTLAEALAKEPTEVAWRTSVSRGYFAAFHEARKVFEALFFAVPGANKLMATFGFG
jgi:hypothetical protein